MERAHARVWQVEEESEASRGLARALGVSEIVARCLLRRGVDTADGARRFLRPTLADGLRSPMEMKDMARAAARVVRALDARETIAVYGDYDVDGMSGAATLLVGLRDLGADPLLFVPDRLRDGYGLCVAGLDVLADAGATLVITSDCGASSHAEVAHAAARGVDVIVCDHHSAPDERPPAFAVLNPIQPGCGFPFKGLCGAAVAFYLLLGARMVLRERGAATVPDVRRYLDLVTLGTIADVVPLRDENRTIVTHGLRRMAATEWPGLRALLESAAVAAASASDVAFRIAPRINASGRVGDPREAIELLATRSTERARVLAAQLERNNEERRRIEAAVLAEAREQAAASLADDPSPALVVAGAGWHPGVVGIVAARLAEEHGRSAVVLAMTGDAARGSARAARGVDLLAALRACGAIFERLGGHRQAAGLTIAAAEIAALRSRFGRAVAEQSRSATGDALSCDAAVEARSFSPEMLQELLCLEPCGAGNPAPTLAVLGAEVLRARVVGSGHVALELGARGLSFPAMAFGQAARCPAVGASVDVMGTPEVDRYRGRVTPRLRVVDLRPSGA